MPDKIVIISDEHVSAIVDLVKASEIMAVDMKCSIPEAAKIIMKSMQLLLNGVTPTSPGIMALVNMPTGTKQ